MLPFEAAVDEGGEIVVFLMVEPCGMLSCL